MKKESGNFEDKLRIRLLSEDLPYDAGAWEGFVQQMEGSPSQKKDKKKGGLGKFRPWIWFLVVAHLLIFVSLFGYFNFGSFGFTFETPKVSSHEVEIAKPQDTKYTTADKGQDRRISSSSLEEHTTSVTEEEDGKAEEKSHEKNIASAERASFNSSYTQRSNQEHKEQDETGGSDFVGKVDRKQDAKNEEAQERGNVFRTRSSNDEVLPPTRIDLDDDQKQGQNNDGALSDKVHASVDEKMDSDGPEERDSADSNTNIGKDVVTKEAHASVDAADSESSRHISLEDIGVRKIQPLMHPVDLDFDLPFIIEPLKYPKNEYYFGAGFVNRYSEFTTRLGTSRAQQRPTYFSLGYFRKISPSWSLGIEAHVAHLQSLPMSRELKDYHQTSVSFEYIEGTYTHNYTNYVGLPIMVKYQNIGSRLGLIGGLNIARAWSKSHNFANEHHGENSVVNFLRAEHGAAQYFKDWDLGLIIGTNMTIWGRLELEGRATLGLVDVSDDYFWGEGVTRTSHYRVGLKYKF